MGITTWSNRSEVRGHILKKPFQAKTETLLKEVMQYFKDCCNNTVTTVDTEMSTASDVVFHCSKKVKMQMSLPTSTDVWFPCVEAALCIYFYDEIVGGREHALPQLFTLYSETFTGSDPDWMCRVYEISPQQDSNCQLTDRTSNFESIGPNENE